MDSCNGAHYNQVVMYHEYHLGFPVINIRLKIDEIKLMGHTAFTWSSFFKTFWYVLYLIEHKILLCSS